MNVIDRSTHAVKEKESSVGSCQVIVYRLQQTYISNDSQLLLTQSLWLAAIILQMTKLLQEDLFGAQLLALCV